MTTNTSTSQILRSATCKHFEVKWLEVGHKRYGFRHPSTVTYVKRIVPLYSCPCRKEPNEPGEFLPSVKWDGSPELTERITKAIKHAEEESNDDQS